VQNPEPPYALRERVEVFFPELRLWRDAEAGMAASVVGRVAPATVSLHREPHTSRLVATRIAVLALLSEMLPQANWSAAAVRSAVI